MKKDYYEILGVAKDASVSDIKKKYRSFALKFHPDRVPQEQKKEAEEKFKELSEAYGVLSDPSKRKLYDQYGHSGIDQNYTTDDIFKGADFSSVFGEMGLDDIFSQVFGGGGGGLGDIFGRSGGRSSQRVHRGRDIQYEIDLTLEESFNGVSKKIKVPRNEFCKDCDGTGAKDGKSLKNCSTCGGSGTVVTSSGFFRMQQTCPSCRGAGKVVIEQCNKCFGQGYKRVERSIDVSIPAGVDNSSRLRIRGEGEIAKGGAGDLYLYIHVLPHKIFQRNENDIYMEQAVSFTIAAIGGELSVPTLNGSVMMKIPSGTQSGKVFRLKSKGMPDLHSQNSQGDQYVKVMIQVPSKLTQEQRNLLEEFARISGEDISLFQKDSLNTIKEKIKKVFK